MPVYVHLGRLWSDAAGASIDPDTVVPEVVPLLAPGDILAHPFTKNPGAFVSREGRVHPLILEAVKVGVHIDIGRGGHMSFGQRAPSSTPGSCRSRREATSTAIPSGGSRTAPGMAGISTDAERRRRAAPAIGGAKVYSLTQVLNELLALGIQLEDVVRMVT